MNKNYYLVNKNKVKIIITLILIFVTSVHAKDYKLSVAKLPLYSESPTKGILIDVLKAMDEEYKEGNFIIEVYPFQRSIDNVISGRADFHFPTIGPNIWGREDDNYELALSKQGVRRSTASLTKTHFALFSNSNHPPLDIANIEDYRIETDLGHTIFFYNGIQGTTCLPCSVEKLSAGRLDGLIFASREIEFMAKDAGITNIQRQNYKIFGSKFILPIGKKGNEIDQLISRLIIKILKNGKLQKVAAPYLNYFQKEYHEQYLPQLDEIPNHLKNN